MGCVQVVLHRRVHVPAISRESLCLILVCLVDTIVTALLVNAGMACEANPLMARIMAYGIPVFCVAKMLTVLPLVILAEWYRKHNPGFIRGALRVGIAAYLCIYLVSVAAVNV